jgi:hypothetical protein
VAVFNDFQSRSQLQQMTAATTTSVWRTLHATMSVELTDSRLQLHYAAQFATALGISYLAPRADDSHTNLGWDARHEALTSREVRAPSHAVQVAVRPSDLTLLVLLDGSIGHTVPFHGSSIGQIETALRETLASAGLDARRFTLKRHYELPHHPVGNGELFDARKANHFAELASWYSNGALAMQELANRIGGAEVRCWPHHFDIATLARFGPSRSSGAGMLPGDEMYPEPYFYVNAYPAPANETVGMMLNGKGTWNTDGWFGAVLTGSRVTQNPSAQEEQVRAFLDSAYAACSALVRK